MGDEGDNNLDEQRRALCTGVGRAKCILIDIDGALYRAGFQGSSDSLGKIIAQLERWEARHAR